MPLFITVFRIRRLSIQASTKTNSAVEGKNVLLTFGLLSLEQGHRKCAERDSNGHKKAPLMSSILSLGLNTSSNILKSQGETYRIMLQQLARKLDISEHIIFQNRFVALK